MCNTILLRNQLQLCQIVMMLISRRCQIQIQIEAWHPFTTIRFLQHRHGSSRILNILCLLMRRRRRFNRGGWVVSSNHFAIANVIHLSLFYFLMNWSFSCSKLKLLQYTRVFGLKSMLLLRSLRRYRTISFCCNHIWKGPFSFIWDRNLLSLIIVAVVN